MIRQQVKWYLDELDVQENFHLTVVFSTRMPDKLEGLTSSHTSPEPDKYHIIRVLIDAKLSSAKQLLVLAHEMVHVKQYVKNELMIPDDKRVIWKGKEYYLSHDYNRFLPWEKEAYYADLKLVRQVKSSWNQMQEILAGTEPLQISKITSGCNYLSGKCTGKIQIEPLAKETPDS